MRYPQSDTSEHRDSLAIPLQMKRRAEDADRRIKALRRDYERLQESFESSIQSFMTEIRERRQIESELRAMIEELETQLIERIDTESRLEEQARQLVGLAEDLDVARNEMQRLVNQRDRFFSIIAHDLRSPFNALLGYSEILAAQANELPRETLADYGQQANDAAQRTFKLLENLLHWAQLQTGSIEYAPQTVTINDTIAANLALFEAPATVKQLTLRANVTPACGVHADPQMVDTILRNLINNAVKFTPNGGTITVAARRQKDRVTISVRDTGVGIPPETLPLLFKLEEKVSTPGTNGEPSTGLGLQLCHELARQHGSEITVKSRVNVGSTFSFALQAIPPRRGTA